MKKQFIIYLSLIFLAAGCAKKNRSIIAVNSEQSPVPVELNKVDIGEKDQNQKDVKDLIEITKLGNQKLKVVVKSTEQVISNAQGNAHVISEETKTLKCEFYVVSYDYPRNGSTYRHIGYPQISDEGTLVVEGRIVDTRSTIRQKAGFGCSTTKASDVTKLTLGDLKKLFKDSLEITIVPR